MNKLCRLASAMVAAAALAGLSAGSAQAAASHALIQGSGSSWAANAVNQWIADVEPNGLQVVFTSTGSAQGRKDFANSTTDFAVSDIGFQGRDPVTGDEDSSGGRDFAYLPIVAGGTSFPYQVRVAGQLVRNIRLSGETLAKIFTNQITDWSDPAITKDNNGRALPSLKIVPVVHSEGSGSTAQFTRYLDHVHPSIWRPFFGRSGPTEYFPRQGSQIAQNGSDGVINFLTSKAGNGAIAYDEYSYALAKDYPVVKLENAAGYFTAPTQYNVAVALTQAKINLDRSSKEYLLQDLDGVYTYGDARTYPMSSYSYMIIPTGSSDGRMTTAKRQTLADFLYYSICQGQAEMGPIGYSPLPINLVQRSFEQTAKLKDADAAVDLTKRDVSTCDNPTFVKGQPNRNYLAEIAPKPPACDKAGAGPCTGTEGLATGNPKSGKPTGSGARGGGTGSTSGGTTPVTSGTGSPPPTAAATGSTGAVVDPLTGAPSGGGTTDLTVASRPTVLPSSRLVGSTGVLGGLCAAVLLLALLAPPVTARLLRRRAATP